MSYVLRQAHAEEAHALKQKAMEPHIRHCYIQKTDVNILIEYSDYKHPQNKGPEGAIYCENIIYCYQNNVKCRYSGISPSYPDPFIPREFSDSEDEELDTGAGDDQSEDPE